MKNSSTHLGKTLPKLCIIGDSHVGALKKAWTAIGERHSAFSITFFAQRGHGLANLVVKGGKLHPSNEAVAKALKFVSGGHRYIDPHDYDVFVIYSCGARANFVSGMHYYSQAVQQRAVHDLVDGTLSFELLKKLRAITRKPVYVGHNPLRSARDNGSGTGSAAYLAGLDKLNELVYRPLAATILAQPLQTIVNGRATAPDFTKGSRRLAIGDRFDNEIHTETDDNHMNEAFGELWLVALLKMVTVSAKVKPRARR